MQHSVISLAQQVSSMQNYCTTAVLPPFTLQPQQSPTQTQTQQYDTFHQDNKAAKKRGRLPGKIQQASITFKKCRVSCMCHASCM